MANAMLDRLCRRRPIENGQTSNNCRFGFMYKSSHNILIFDGGVGGRDGGGEP